MSTVGGCNGSGKALARARHLSVVGVERLGDSGTESQSGEERSEDHRGVHLDYWLRSRVD